MTIEFRRFRDRRDAGRQLGERLRPKLHRQGLVVLALPRGGVPVGFEVAEALDAPLDVFLVRKLGAPHNPELAMGAIATGSVQVLNQDIVEALDIPREVIHEVASRELEELRRREREYRGDRPRPRIAGRTVVMVDDGLATGASMRAAIEAVRVLGPKHIVAAVPVAPEETCRALAASVDAVECLLKPAPFGAVGLWYEEFAQTTDDEVRALLREAEEHHHAA
jgi:predicted phosphoribosyltransferase